MKKSFLILLSLALTLFLILSGCTSSNSSPAVTTQDDSVITPAGTFPIVNKPVTLKVMVVGDPRVQDLSTNEFSKWYEQKTNVHIDWEVVQQKEANDKLNLSLASGDYPDVIMGFQVNPTQQMIEGSQGVFLPLNSYIDKYGMETKKIFQQYSFLKDMSTAPDGNIYSLPRANSCYHCTFPQKMWIYQPWLDKLGLKMPTTTDEFEQVLKAFKEKDPNGNGKSDEIPLTGLVSSTGFPSIVPYLMNSFILSNDNYLTLKDGKVDVAFNKPEWKQGLQYLHKLYMEGLIAPQSFTQDSTQLLQMGENPDVPIAGAVPAENQGVFTQFYGKSDRWAQYTTLPPLKGPNGLQVASHNPIAGGMALGTFVVTKNCKYPAVAFRWADAMYALDVSLLSNEGRQDQEWRYAKPGEKAINGQEGQWARIASFGQVQNFTWGTSIVHPSARNNDTQVVTSEPSLETILYNQSKNNYDPYKQPDNTVIPPLFFTQDQSAKVADLSKTINDYVNQMIARFITGDADLDKDWNTYLQTLMQMNVQEYVQINQDAYNAKQKK